MIAYPNNLIPPILPQFQKDWGFLCLLIYICSPKSDISDFSPVKTDGFLEIGFAKKVQKTNESQ